MPERPTSFEQPPFGCDVLVNAYYFRHAEKASGAVGSGDKISSSLISERGKRQSRSLGIDLKKVSPPGEQGIKIGSSNQPRTLETAQEIGSTHSGAGMQRFFPREKQELRDNAPKAFTEAYIRKWEERKREIMARESIDPSQFPHLSAQEQARIAEPAEEPLFEEWLDNPESDLAHLYPPEQAAISLAPLVHRDIEMPQRLHSGTSVDLLRVTHRTVTEPLLMRIAILANGQKPQKLADIGGPLGLNDGWNFRTSTDHEGIPHTSIFMYRVHDREKDDPEYEITEFGIDLAELKRLAQIKINQKREK